VPLHAHHDNLHFQLYGEPGRAVHALVDAGHIVIPGAPLTDWADCAEFLAIVASG
jgi:hypothetical protein